MEPNPMQENNRTKPVDFICVTMILFYELGP